MSRITVLALAALYAFWITRLAYLPSARLCRATPTWRAPCVVLGVAGMAVSGWLVPWIAELRPPFSESPSGIFVILGKLLLVSTLAFASLGATLGGAFPGYGRDKGREGDARA